MAVVGNGDLNIPSRLGAFEPRLYRYELTHPRLVNRPACSDREQAERKDKRSDKVHAHS